MDNSAIPADFARRVAGNLSPHPIAASTPLGAHVGDYLEIVGATVKTPEVSRGQTAEIAVVMRGLKPLPTGYRMFAHLRSPSGGFVNGDHDLLEGLLPPPRLRPGMYVRDVMHLPIPASFSVGEATLLLGFYNREGRIPVSGPAAVTLTTERAVRAATVQVR
jgi:hypothetical protein